MALPVAGGFPNLRSLSIDPNSSPVIRTDSIVAGYMATSEDILGVVLQALERRLQSRNRNSIKNIYNIEYIKIMRNVWRLNIMDSESSNRVSAEKLKRADLLAMEIPPLFLIEEIEGRASIWDEVEGRS